MDDHHHEVQRYAAEAHYVAVAELPADVVAELPGVLAVGHCVVVQVRYVAAAEHFVVVEPCCAADFVLYVIE